MTFDPRASVPLSDELEGRRLPAAACTACGRRIKRRGSRVIIFPTWRRSPDALCPQCWLVICAWASKFALLQLALPEC